MNINIRNININYSKDGNSEKVLLLLHGWGSNITLFNNIICAMCENFTVYAIDMPGFGKSEEPKIAWCVDDYVNCIIEFIQKMNIKELSILGHSFGGRVIIKMCNVKDLPFKIQKVVLVDSAGILPRKSYRKKIKIGFYKMSKCIVNNSIVRKIYPEALEKLKSKSGSPDYKNATPIMRETLVKTVNEDLTHLLKDITQPTLLIWGDKDEDTPITDAQKMEQLIPDAGLVTIKGAGHYSFLEQPYLVNNVLNVFLNDKE